MLNMAVHLSSQRNKRKFVDEQSYVYVFNNKNKDGSVEYWTCEEKIFCRAKVHVSNDKVIRAIGNHTHGFQSSLSCSHPSLWKLIEQLKKEEGLQHFYIVQLMNGASVSKRRKYRCCEARIRTIMQRCPTMKIVDFLRAIANNLAI